MQVAVESLDVRDEVAVNACMQRIVDANGRNDMLINSAGIVREDNFKRLPMKGFRDVTEIDYSRLLIATRAALPHLRASSGNDSLRYRLKPVGIKAPSGLPRRIRFTHG